MERLEKQVLLLGERGLSLRQIGDILGVSKSKVKQILLSHDQIDNPYYKLFREGKSVDEVAERMMVRRSTVVQNLPYKRGGPYNKEHPTDNALNIRKSRERKKNNAGQN